MAEDDHGLRLDGPYIDVTQLPVSPPDRDMSRVRDGNLFDDYDEDDEIWNRLTEMWQMGILDARWNEDSQTTEYQMTGFGKYLQDHGLYSAFDAQQELTESELDDTPPAVGVLNS